MNAHLIGAALASLSLAACSGGGGGSGGGTGGLDPSFKADPVIASGPPPASLGELAGTTFPLRLSRIETDGVADDTSRLELAVEVLSDSQIVLHTPSGPVLLTQDGAGDFVGSLGGSTYVIESLGLGFPYSQGVTLLIDHGTSGSLSTGYFGLEAPQSALDAMQAASVVAAYSGDSMLQFIDGGTASTDVADANLLVDFGNSTVTGTVYETASLEMHISGGTVTGNGIDGMIFLDGPDSAGYVLYGSDVDGQFFGVHGNVLQGTFEGAGFGPAGNVEFVGSFHTID